MNKKVIARIAPSPTGFMTIANLRTALYNYLFARKHNGEFHLRFEDTDKNREVSNAKHYIIDSFNWLGLNIDGDIITQSENLEKYKELALKLIESGHAYYAFDDADSLEKLRGNNPQKPIAYSAYTRMLMKNSLTLSQEEVKLKLDNKEPFVIRFKTEKNKEIKFKDLIRKDVSFNTNNLDDKVLFKSDGFPTYHSANVKDDSDLGVTHVIRGNEWLPSTPLHIMLYEAIGLPVPTFAHLPLVLDENGKKISKRNHKKYDYPIFPLSGNYTDKDGTEFNVTGFKEEGYLPEALLNALFLIGFSPKGETDVLTMDEMIEQFELNEVHSNDAMFSITKLKFLNKEHLKRKPIEYLYSFINKGDKFKYDEEKLKLIVDIALERSTFANELNDAVDYFFNDVNYSKTKPKTTTEFMYFSECFLGSITDNINFTSKEQVSTLIDLACEASGVAKGKILPDLRNALCGGKSGAELTVTAMILGRDETDKRIKDFIEYVQKEEYKNYLKV